MAVPLSGVLPLILIHFQVALPSWVAWFPTTCWLFWGLSWFFSLTRLIFKTCLPDTKLRHSKSPASKPKFWIIKAPWSCGQSPRVSVSVCRVHCTKASLELSGMLSTIECKEQSLDQIVCLYTCSHLGN